MAARIGDEKAPKSAFGAGNDHPGQGVRALLGEVARVHHERRRSVPTAGQRRPGVHPCESSQNRALLPDAIDHAREALVHEGDRRASLERAGRDATVRQQRESPDGPTHAFGVRRETLDRGQVLPQVAVPPSRQLSDGVREEGFRFAVERARDRTPNCRRAARRRDQLLRVGLDRAAELVGAHQLPSPSDVSDREDERPAVRVGAAPGVPVQIGARPESCVLGSKARERRVDPLFLRSREPDRLLAALQREHLRPQHRGVGDADQAVGALAPLRLRNEEEPRPVGRRVHVDRLQHPVQPLLFRGKQREVALRGGGHRFDHVLERVAVLAAQQVEHQHRNLRVGEEERMKAPLREVARDGGVVGEVAVVHERLVHADEGVRTARVPDASLRRVAVVADPYVSGEVLEAVCADDVVPVADQLEDDEILRVREHERALLPG